MQYKSKVTIYSVIIFEALSTTYEQMLCTCDLRVCDCQRYELFFLCVTLQIRLKLIEEIEETLHRGMRSF